VYKVLLPCFSPPTLLLPSPPPSGTYPQAELVLHSCHLILRIRFYVWERKCDIYLSHPCSFCLTWWSLVIPIFLQVDFYSSLWLNDTLLSMYTSFFRSIHWLMSS
jgi:hypothetical protein